MEMLQSYFKWLVISLLRKKPKIIMKTKFNVYGIPAFTRIGSQLFS